MLIIPHEVLGSGISLQHGLCRRADGRFGLVKLRQQVGRTVVEIGTAVGDG